MKERIDRDNLPKHIAVIMDGNGRWAQKKGAARIFGHRNAIKAVREVTEGCAELGIGYLTLYAFSTENWARPKYEVMALMELLVHTIKDELPTLQKNNVKLAAIGEMSTLPGDCASQLEEAIQKTSRNTGLTLILALGYSGKWDLTQATRQIANEIKNGTLQPDDINEHLIEEKLSTRGKPQVDLMLRTGGDHRISNFLLWQLAYAELYIFDDVYWPDFRKNHLYEALLKFQETERRFGKTSDQIKEESSK